MAKREMRLVAINLNNLFQKTDSDMLQHKQHNLRKTSMRKISWEFSMLPSFLRQSPTVIYLAICYLKYCKGLPN